ncbi:MAG: ATP-binding cassette domain-containing protein [Leptospirales bacterium]
MIPQKKFNILIKDASFRYHPDDEVPVFESLNFELRTGENVFVLGNSSSGKSSLVKAILGLLHLSEGSYEAFDKNMKDPSVRTLHTIRRKIGILPDRGILINHLSVEGNLRFPLRFIANYSKQKCHEIVSGIIKEHDLFSIQDCLPFELSINMIKTVGLLRALLFEPALLILDDPFEGLDGEGVRFFQMVFNQLKKSTQTSILMLSRKPVLIPGVFDRFCEVTSGGIKTVDSSRIEELERACSLYTPGSPGEILKT